MKMMSDAVLAKWSIPDAQSPNALTNDTYNVGESSVRTRSADPT
jgi:hypothetical protein